MSLITVLESVALVSASIYAGATYYVAAVEQPSRLGAPAGLDLEAAGRTIERRDTPPRHWWEPERV